MRRGLRVLMVLTAAVVLVGVTTPPALAGDSFEVAFKGILRITKQQGNGLGYPCTPAGTTGTCPTVPATNLSCVTTGLRKCGPVSWNLPNAPMLNGTFTTLTCTGSETKAGVKGKAGKPATMKGTCLVSFSGSAARLVDIP
jgi:hypothetical protein